MLSRRRLGPWFLFALLLVFGWIALQVLGVFVDYVLIGGFLAFITYPIYAALRNRIKNDAIASLTMLLLIVATIVVPISLLSVELAGEVQSINRELGLHDPQQLVNSTAATLGPAFGMDPTAAGEVVSGAYNAVRDLLTDQVKKLPAQAAGALVGLFVLFYVVYYAYVDGERFVNFIRGLMPMDEGHRDLLLHEVANVTKAVMLGTVLTAAIQAALGAIGFAIFGVDNILFWGVIMFILALLPVVGPPLVWAPWGIYLIVNGATGRGIGLLIYCAIMVSMLDNLIRPKLIGKVAHIHPVVVLLGVLGGVAVFGFPGFLLGPLVLSIFVTILQVYRKEFATRMDDWGDKESWFS